MILTLLVDLDDTLLGNKMETFIPAYLKALGTHLADIVAPGVMIESMLKATECMFSNTRIDRTLKETFDERFYPPLGLKEAEVRPTIEKFYQSVFPVLEGKTQYLSKAVRFIQDALSQDYDIGIATNPVFPRTAIVQRLGWAGLSPDRYDFSLIPSFETFHFAKPNPAYFAEFLTQIGWPEGPIVMIGNDPDHDIKGSRLMGIPSFWIRGENSKYPEGLPKPTASGRIEEVHPWIQSQPEELLTPDLQGPDSLMAVLRGSPAGLTSRFSEISEREWNAQPEEGEWNLTEIACHLRDVEREINYPRIYKILEEENTFISGVDSDRWAIEREYFKQNGSKAFEDFILARKETLKLLDQVQEGDWAKGLRHAIFGPTDMREMVRIMTAHEILHDRQITRVMKLLFPSEQSPQTTQ
jgi:FMN phosphatase YigB (HAD superfamily)